MQREITTTIAKIIPIIDYLKEHSIGSPEFVRRAGLEPSLLDSPENRLDMTPLLHLIELIVSFTGLEELGLLAGREVVSFSNILSYVLANCSTIAECYSKLRDYERVLDEFFRIDLKEREGKAELSLHSSDSRLDSNRVLVDFKLTATMSYCRTLTGKSIIPLKAMFSYSPPADLRAYKRQFNCPITFNAPFTAIVLNSDYLRLPTVAPNRELLKVFEQHACQVLKRLGSLESFSGRVRSLILKQMQGEPPKIEQIAYALVISVRCLQTRLKEEGTSYSKLLDSVRRELAFTYLKDQKNTIGDISYLLGFADPSIFHRTFKKWSSFTPGQYRTRHLSPSE